MVFYFENKKEQKKRQNNNNAVGITKQFSLIKMYFIYFFCRFIYFFIW